MYCNPIAVPPLSEPDWTAEAIEAHYSSTRDANQPAGTEPNTVVDHLCEELLIGDTPKKTETKTR